MPAHPTTPTQRVPVVAHLLAHEGAYGLVTTLSQLHAVSRETLYDWRERSRAGVVRALTPVARGSACLPAPARTTLVRAILTLLVQGHASYRGIQVCLRELCGWEVGLGTIAAIVAEAGEQAQTVLTGLVPPGAVVLAVDECFGGGPQAGYLSAVDARTGVVWGLTGPVGPDAAQWAALLEGLVRRGVEWTGTVHDGGKAAAGGVTQVTPAVPHQRDLWHVLYRVVQSRARLERQEAAALERWEAAERYAETVATRGRRPRQRPPQPVAVAIERVTAAERARADLRYLSEEFHHLLGVVVVEHGRLRDVAARRADLETVLVLLAELAATAPAEARDDLTALHHQLTATLDGLLVFTAELAGAEAAARTALGPAAVDLLAWAWARRAILAAGEELLAQLPPDWPAAADLLAAWEGTVRASSAVEGWHSLLRPHLAVHRTLSPGLLALLAVWHNHRVYARGAHAGQSPLHLSGLVDAPPDWLTALGYPPATVARPVPAPLPLPVPQEVPMAA